MKKTSLLSALRESSNEELVARIKRLDEELFQHRLKRFTNQLENVNLIRTARREIATAQTVLSGRKHGTETQQAAKAAAKE